MAKSLDSYRFNPERICGAILEKPIVQEEKIHKGAVIIACPDEVVKQIPELRDYFYIIERRGWIGMSDASCCDIKLVEDPLKLEETRRQLPNALLLDVAGGDFVDTNKFRPINLSKVYAGIQIARWCGLKRHELFIEGAHLVPTEQFLKFGNFYRGGTDDEKNLRKKVMNFSKELGANVDFLYSELESNIGLPDSEEVNRYINNSRLGIITSISEGNNRFKTECMAADIPVLMPADINGGAALKHINVKTGLIFEPTSRGLSDAINYALRNYNQFSPREYILNKTGIKNSTKVLRNALESLAMRDGLMPHYEDIYWDGREQTLCKYDAFLRAIRATVTSARGKSK